MSQHLLDDEDITTGFQLVCSEAVTQGMNTAGPSDPGPLFGLIIEFLRGANRHRSVFISAGEEPDRGTAETPVGPEFLNQPGREMGIAIFVAFALINPEQAPGTLDMPGLETDNLAYPQPGDVDGHQQRPVFGISGELDQAKDFLDGERIGEFLLFSTGWNREGPIRSFEDSGVQKPEGRKGNVTGAPGEFQFLDQMEQIPLDLVLGQLIRGLHIEFSQTGNRFQIRGLGSLSQMSQSHLVEHSGTKGSAHAASLVSDTHPGHHSGGSIEEY